MTSVGFRAQHYTVGLRTDCLKLCDESLFVRFSALGKQTGTEVRPWHQLYVREQ